MSGESGRSGCEKHAESPKPRQGQQKQEDQLCSRVHARVCVCQRLCTLACVCVCVRSGPTAGRARALVRGHE